MERLRARLPFASRTHVPGVMLDRLRSSRLYSVLSARDAACTLDDSSWVSTHPLRRNMRGIPSPLASRNSSSNSDGCQHATVEAALGRSKPTAAAAASSSSKQQAAAAAAASSSSSSSKQQQRQQQQAANSKQQQQQQQQQQP